VSAQSSKLENVNCSARLLRMDTVVRDSRKEKEGEEDRVCKRERGMIMVARAFGGSENKKRKK